MILWGPVVCAQSSPALCNPMDSVAHQSPLSMEFSNQEFWSRLLFPTPGNLPNPGIKPMSPASPALARGYLLLCHLGNHLGAYWWLFLALLQVFPANYFIGSFLPQFKTTVSDLQTCIHSPKVLTRNLCIRNQSCASVWSLYPREQSFILLKWIHLVRVLGLSVSILEGKTVAWSLLGDVI